MRERGLAAPFPSELDRDRVQGLICDGGRADDAEAVRLDGGRGHHQVAEVARRRVPARRGAHGGRDGQGDGRLRGRGGRHARVDPRPRRRGGARSGSRSPCSPAAARSPHRRSRSRRTARRRSRTGRTRRRSRGGPRSSSGVSLHGIAGTGPGGRITREDVQRAAGAGATAAPAAPAADGRGDVSVVELTPTQSTIARRMAQSAATIPASRSRSTPTCRRSSRCAAARARSRRRALAQRLRRQGGRADAARVPAVQRVVRRRHRRVLLARQRRHRGRRPTTRCSCRSSSTPTQKTLAEIAAETRRLADGARGRSLRPEELHGGTFTVSNLGMFGVALVHRDRRPAAGGDPRRRRGRRAPSSGTTAASRSTTR